MALFECQHCGGPYSRPPAFKGKYCGTVCMGKAQSARKPRKVETFNCETCQKEVTRLINGARRGRFCSLQCRRVLSVDRMVIGKYWHIRLPVEERKRNHLRGHKARSHRAFTPEHIVFAERALGRPLKKGEVVHHINCDQLDNSRGNLLVCTRAYHAWLHGEMSRRYGQEKFGRVA